MTEYSIRYATSFKIYELDFILVEEKDSGCWLSMVADIIKKANQTLWTDKRIPHHEEGAMHTDTRIHK